MDTIEAVAKGKPVEPVTPVTPAPIEPSKEGTPVEPSTPENIISRVTNLKKEEIPNQPVSPVKEGTEVFFNRDDLTKIKTPEEAVAYAEAAYKSMEKGYQVKFQDLATERKSFETKQTAPKEYTKASIQEMVNDPKFIQAAEALKADINPTGGVISNEEWSTLTDTEKADIKETKGQVTQLIQENNRMKLEQQHKDMEGKYSTYDRKNVMDLYNSMAKGETTITTEGFHKYIDYEAAIKRGYDLGRQDERNGIQEKHDASTPVTTSTTITPSDKIERMEGEPSVAYFARCAKTRLAARK